MPHQEKAAAGWMSLFRHWKITAIGAVLLLALLLRVSQVPYGLPYHLFGDEEANVYGALQMIQMETVLPVLHQADFEKLLYYPPLLAYLYAVIFIPVIGVMYLTTHASLHDLQNLLTLDPSVLWYIARGLQIIFELGIIYLVYRLGRLFFKDKTAAVLSAFFLATSFTEVTVSSAIHHWTPAIFFCLLSLFLIVRSFQGEPKRKTRLLIWAGVASAAAFGIDYSVYFLPFMVLLICYLSGMFGSGRKFAFKFDKARLRYIFVSLLYFFVPFTILAVAMIAVYPAPLFGQVINHTGGEPDVVRSIPGFMGYYAGVMWRDELPLLIFSIIGAMMLAWKRRKLFLGLAVFFLTWSVLTYAFLFNIARYLLPAFPFIALVAGFGLCELVRFIPKKEIVWRKMLVVVLSIVLCAYFVAVFGRYTTLLWRNDTRIVAKEWIETNIPSGSVVIIDSERLRLLGTSASVRYQASIDPQSLRAADRVMMENDSYATHPFSLTSLYYATHDEKKTLIDTALSLDSAEKYFIYDSWIPNRDFVDELRTRGDLVQTFVGSVNDKSQIELPIGGDRGQSKTTSIISQLYGMERFGPDVFVYKLK